MVPAQAEKVLRKLRKTLHRFPARPSIEEVHDLRNQARRFEAIADTLKLDGSDSNARLLKTIKTIRKAAGAVRDMDVLSQDALTLAETRKSRDETPILRLLHHLHSERMRNARKLKNAVKRRRASLTREFKRATREVKKRLMAAGAKDLAKGGVNPLEEASLMDLMLDLRLWPDLSAENLHAFRLKVKHLRILLQMAGGGETQLSKDLATTKDLIGDWHDWLELGKIADKNLTQPGDPPILRKVHGIEAEKLKAALTGAERLLDRHVRFNPGVTA